MIVALRSLIPEGRPEGTQAGYLSDLAALDPGSPHGLTDDPSGADAVLLTDAPGGYRLAKALLRDPWIEACWDKLFLYSEEPRPVRPLPGLFTSHPSTPLDPLVSRAIGYPCWPLNPWIDQEAEAPPAREPELLYSFMGRDSHPVRRGLFEVAHPADTHVVDTSRTYRHLVGDPADRRDAERDYVDVALRSRFALCPRGWATSTVRVYEMMALGVAPVILGDRWVPPTGPDWSSFAIFVPEGEVASLPELLRERQEEWRDLGMRAFEAFREYFRRERHWRTLTSALAELTPRAAEARAVLRRRWLATLPTMITRDAVRRAGKLISG